MYNKCYKLVNYNIINSNYLYEYSIYNCKCNYCIRLKKKYKLIYNLIIFFKKKVRLFLKNKKILNKYDFIFTNILTNKLIFNYL